MTSGAPRPYEPPPRRPGAGHGGPDRPRGGRRTRWRPRARAAVPLGVAVLAVLEVRLLTAVADASDGLVVLALIAAGLVLGAAAVRHAGRRAWRDLVRAMEDLRPGAGPHGARTAPGTATGGGHGLAVLGGLLLMLPGLLSDAAGLLCLFPPTAALLRRAAERRLGRGGFAPGTLGDALRQARAAEEQVRIHRPDGKVVEGEVVRDEDGPRP